MIASIETTVRSLPINFIMMPYTKLLLPLASVDSEPAKQRLEDFEAARGEFLKWLNISNIWQLLSRFAYLSSNPKEVVAMEDMKQVEEDRLQRSVW